MPSALEIVLTPLGRLLRHKHAGDENSIRHQPGLHAKQELRLTSSSFAHQGVIPDRHSAIGRGDNVSPALAWSAVPEATVQLLLVMEDVDVPFKRPSIHLAALFSPSITHFDEGVLTPDNAELRYIPTRRGRTGYYGPRPLPGHGPHRYIFHLYALDQAIPQDTPLASLDELLPLTHGHVIARGYLQGVQVG